MLSAVRFVPVSVPAHVAAVRTTRTAVSCWPISAACPAARLAKETVRHWMRDAGLWVPRRQRPPKAHQPVTQRLPTITGARLTRTLVGPFIGNAWIPELPIANQQDTYRY
jgi:hypothetical protein